jgi:hypothetical protein
MATEFGEVFAHYVTGPAKNPQGKSAWMLYDHADNQGGSLREVYATDYDDLISQVSLETEKAMNARMHALLLPETRNEELREMFSVEMDSMSAQRSDDYSQVVHWYADGCITVMVGDMEHPYSPDDV